MRWFALVSAFAVFPLFALTAPSADACSKQHQTVFELFERATTVAVVKVRWMPKSTRPGLGPAGDMDVEIKQLLKGKAGGKVLAKETNTSCAAGFRTGETALVFLDAHGWPSGAYEGRVSDYKKVLPTIEKLAGAPDDAARGQVAIDALGEPAVAEEAAYWVADRPDLLARLDQAAIDRVRAAGEASSWADSRFATVLVRLRVPNVDAIIAKQSPGMRRQLSELAATKTFDAVTDPNALADAIEAKGSSEIERIAALDRCERVRRGRLAWFNRYIRGVAAGYWPVLAAACRSGTPITD